MCYKNIKYNYYVVNKRNNYIVFINKSMQIVLDLI